MMEKDLKFRKYLLKHGIPSTLAKAVNAIPREMTSKEPIVDLLKALGVREFEHLDNRSNVNLLKKEQQELKKKKKELQRILMYFYDLWTSDTISYRGKGALIMPRKRIVIEKPLCGWSDYIQQCREIESLVIGFLCKEDLPVSTLLKLECHLDPDHLSWLDGVLKNNLDLKEIHCHVSELTEEMVDYLEQLTEISFTITTSAASLSLKASKKAPRFTNLHHLRVEDVQKFPSLAGVASNLESLEIYYGENGSDKSISDSISQWSNLKKFVIHGKNIVEPWKKQIDSLVYLDLSHTMIAKSKSLSVIGKLVNLETLKLSDCGFEKSPLAELKLPNLQHVDLSQNPVKEIQLPESIVTVDLSHTNIEFDSFVESVSEMPKLQKVILNGCSVTNGSLSRLLQKSVQVDISFDLTTGERDNQVEDIFETSNVLFYVPNQSSIFVEKRFELENSEGLYVRVKNCLKGWDPHPNFERKYYVTIKNDEILSMTELLRD